MHTTSLDWASNDEKSRWFVVLRLDHSKDDGLNKLLHASNEACKLFGQPLLYKPRMAEQVREPAHSQLQDLARHCHISIAWSLDQSAGTYGAASGNHDVNVPRLKVPVDLIKVKMGNMVHSFSLSQMDDENERSPSYLGS